jgi:LPS-assembly lipoprotein
MKTRLLLICLLILTSACGFHLRGSQLTEFDVSNIYINPSSAPLLAREVTSQLEGAGVSLASSPQSASYIVTLKEERFEKAVLSVSAATGKVEEYLITYKALMDAAHADGKQIVKDDYVTLSRDLTFDENAVLGKFSEEELIHEDMVRRAASQVLRRLQALLTTQK